MIGAGAADDGFHEAVGIVMDLDSTVERLCTLFGYATLWRGRACPGAVALMGIDPSIEATEALIGDASQGRGFIRLFSFPGSAASVMRDGAQPWDTGGIFDINIRSLGSIETLHGRMSRAGFSAFAPITEYGFAGVRVKQVVERDADGLAIALIERLAPKLGGFEQVENHVSYVFNSTQIVPSLQAARALLVDCFGWQPVLQASWTHPDGRNCMGLPLDVAKTRSLSMGLFQANGAMRGSVELIEYAGECLDFSQARPPGRGWAGLRFPVCDIASFQKSAERGGCHVTACTTLAMHPYGQMQAAAAITPWGARFEAYR